MGNSRVDTIDRDHALQAMYRLIPSLIGHACHYCHGRYHCYYYGCYEYDSRLRLTVVLDHTQSLGILTTSTAGLVYVHPVKPCFIITSLVCPLERIIGWIRWYRY